MKFPLLHLASRGLVLALGLILTSCDSIPATAASGPATEMAPPPPAEVRVVEVMPAPPVSRVIFFSEPNFRGESFVVEAGAEVDNLAQLPRSRSSWDRAISSFRIEGVATVVVFSDTRFRGARLESSSSLPDLVVEQRGGDPGTNWDHIIGSLRVVPPRPRAPGPAPAYDARTAENVVRRAYRDLLGREPDADGLRHYRDKLLHEGWSEEMLRAQLKRSEESHAINPDDVIKRAYREILKREPDADGLQHYRDLMNNSRWTEGQVRAALLRSVEERNTAIRATITRAYRELLGREPDAAGYANYEHRMRDQDWTEHQVREALMKSQEYKDRPRK